MDLKQNLADIIPKHALKNLSGHFEVTGDIAVISVPKECEDFEKEIAECILVIRKDVKTVLKKTSSLRGERRVGKYEYIKGEMKTETIHKEAGYSYRIDLSSVFFSPKLCYERMRIASEIKSDEKIIVPFAGAGPFAIPAADKGSLVVAVEKNPDACHYFMENLKINGLKGKGDIICGDVMDILKIFNKGECFDHAIIPTAYGMDKALFKTTELVKTGGIIHFYTFKAKEEINELIQFLTERGLETVFYRRCGNIAPGIYRWVFDLKKNRSVRYAHEFK